MLKVSKTLDASGLRCPMPVLETKLALRSLGSGEVLLVISTDPASESDFRVFAKQTGNKLLHFESGNQRYQFWIEKS